MTAPLRSSRTVPESENDPHPLNAGKFLVSKTHVCTTSTITT